MRSSLGAEGCRLVIADSQDCRVFDGWPEPVLALGLLAVLCHSVDASGAHRLASGGRIRP